MAEQLVYRLQNVDLLTTAVHEIIPEIADGGYFVPSRVAIELSALTGSIGTIPIVRVGNNGTNDNILSLTTLTTLTNELKKVVVSLETVDTIDITTNPINFEVQTAGGTATVMKCNIYLIGYIR